MTEPTNLSDPIVRISLFITVHALWAANLCMKGTLQITLILLFSTFVLLGFWGI